MLETLVTKFYKIIVENLNEKEINISYVLVNEIKVYFYGFNKCYRPLTQSLIIYILEMICILWVRIDHLFFFVSFLPEFTLFIKFIPSIIISTIWVFRGWCHNYITQLALKFIFSINHQLKLIITFLKVPGSIFHLFHP